MTTPLPRWLLADQLGPHFDDGDETVMVEVLGPFRRRRYHRQKAHLILSAVRHRAQELGDRVDYRRGDTYRELLNGVDLSVINPTSYRLRDLVGVLGKNAHVEVLPSRGFVTSEEDFAAWAKQNTGGRLLMDNFYRHSRSVQNILMSLDNPALPEGGRFNFDHENREPPPKGQTTLGVPEPWFPEEDDIDAEVRDYLNYLEKSEDISFRGVDGPRLFPATRVEALHALSQFIEHRLPTFGPHEDAAMTDDWAMSHSLLSPALNLGLLDPLEVIDQAVAAYHSGAADLPSVEGFVRQIMGWRDWVWQLYWHLGPEFAQSNVLRHESPLPPVFENLDGSAVSSRCVSHVLTEVNQRGWTHHINRLMVLGSVALQRGMNPAELNDWFIDSFVDGTPWVMPANVVGMSQWADGGVVATKPYTSGGSYLKKMTNYCTGCVFKPTERVGETACPMTAGYWAFLHKHQEALGKNHRMAKPLGGMRRLSDIDVVVAQEKERTEW